MTSAPISAMIWVQYGPITIAVRSMTRTPLSGPCRSVMGSQPEGVPDVIGMSVGHRREDQWRGVVADRVDIRRDVLDGPRRLVYPRRLGDEGPRDPSRDRDEEFTRDST